MAKTLQIGFAAVVMSAGVALAFPVYAAAGKSDAAADAAVSTTVDLQHTSTKAAGLTGKKLAQVDQNERRITAELNRQAMAGQTTPANGQQGSLPPSSGTQQAAAESEPENSIQ